MYYIKILLVSFLCLHCFCSGAQNKVPVKVCPLQKVWVVGSESSFSIKGSATVGSYRCDLVEYKVPDTLIITAKSGQGEAMSQSLLSLPVKSFNCHNMVMDHEFQKTLDAKNYPQIGISILNLSQMPDPSRLQSLEATVKITIKNVSKCYGLPVLIYKDAMGRFCLKGSRKLTFSDFNIRPPEKFFGMMKVDNDLEVAFNLALKEIR